MTLWASLALHHAMKYFSIAKRVKYIFLVTNRFDENFFHFVEHYGSFCGLKWRFWWAKIYLAHSQARVIVQTILLLVFQFFFFHALQSGNYSSTVDDAIILVTIIVQFMILWSYDLTIPVMIIVQFMTLDIDIFWAVLMQSLF